MDAAEAKEIEEVCRFVSRAVWIITSADGRHRGGLLATWVLPASLDPLRPTVVTSIGINHYTRELIDASGVFAAHLISADQIDEAWRFGIGSGRKRDKFEGTPWHAEATGSPILDRSLAWLDCSVYDRHDGGDRIYYWADIVQGRLLQPGVSHLTDQQLFAAATEAQKRQLRESMNEDILATRPVYDLWRESRE